MDDIKQVKIRPISSLHKIIKSNPIKKEKYKDSSLRRQRVIGF